ncbi:hypothetical protein FSP39_023231 [Pinctada imbricata]|uniref:C2 domain-containing protein n=1 Tax=Pinctada imbricata TaxID=66713 RepID=A0AA88Y114_PINIB|nr:hypothetical protein FSP39_023231 [Pinctada imbricata]
MVDTNDVFTDKSLVKEDVTAVSTDTPWYKDDSMIWILVGSVVAAVLVLVAIVILFVVCRRRRRKKSWDLGWNDTDCILESKSAPISRNCSPKLEKRKSFPDALADTRGKMVRSLTLASVPSFTLPPERVQPQNGHERSCSLTAMQYQQHLIGHLEPELYRGLSFSDDSSLCLPPSEYGRLWFSVLYDAAVEQLNVNLVKVRELPGRGRNNAPRDPFVKIFLLPDERTCRISKVRKKTLSPMFNESFTFQVDPDSIRSKTLRFSVYDVDKRRVRHSLGHVLVNLADIDILKGDSMFKDLELTSTMCASLGDLQISSTYLPNVDKVKIVVIGARNLRQIDIDQNNSLFVKLQMIHGRKISKVKKTMLRPSTSEPVFNEPFSFSIHGKIIDTCSFELSLMTTTRTPMSHDEVYGRIVLGSFMFARGEELKHWQEMMSQPRVAITRWHQLNPVTHHD